MQERLKTESFWEVGSLAVTRLEVTVPGTPCQRAKGISAAPCLASHDYAGTYLAASTARILATGTDMTNQIFCFNILVRF